MITPTSPFAALGDLAPRTAARNGQIDEFVALLKAQLTKAGNIDHGVPDSVKTPPYGSPTPGYGKPMLLGVPLNLEPSPDDTPPAHGAPTSLDAKPNSRGVPDDATGAANDDTMPLGAPTEVAVTVDEEARDLDMLTSTVGDRNKNEKV